MLVVRAAILVVLFGAMNLSPSFSPAPTASPAKNDGVTLIRFDRSAVNLVPARLSRSSIMTRFHPWKARPKIVLVETYHQFCEETGSAMKPFGTGWSRGVRWVDLEVIRQRGGRPSLLLKGEAKKIADAMGVRNIAVSITHTADQAMAQVIFEN